MTLHGKNTGVAIGTYDITRWLNQVSSSSTIDLADASCFDEPGNSKVFVVGLHDGQASWSGRFSSEVAPLKNVKAVFDDIDAAGNFIPVTLGVDRGFSPGRRVTMGTGYSIKLGVSAPIADVVSVNGDLQAQGGWFDGVVLTAKAAYAATGNGTPVDGLVGTDTSGFAHLHVDARNTRNGITTVKIQDSPDNTVWTDLITFASVAAATGAAQRVDLAAVEHVDRYTRVVVTLAGTSGVATIRVALSRRK